MTPQQEYNRLGSPPHTRERPASRHKTTLARSRDHPRIRGKDCGRGRHKNAILGSPPHTRERRTYGRQYGSNRGITPAYAGKTCCLWCRLLNTWDHPRIRGKDALDCRFSCRASGSPPHTRERHCFWGNGGERQGITPAYAGKTNVVLKVTADSQDHPRIRGKDFAPFVTVKKQAGSPPHTRERRIN